jgi:carbon monoxide dehydrogenase subunit G
MRLQGRYRFKAPREAVWRVLLDPAALARALPGCQRLEEVAPDTYEATLKLGVASVKGTYSGRVTILDKVPPERYRMQVGGSGAQGFLSGEGLLTLAEADGRTVLTYDGEAQVGGLIAGIGQRMLGGVSKLLVRLFFRALAKQLHLAEGDVEEVEPEGESRGDGP